MPSTPEACDSPAPSPPPRSLPAPVQGKALDSHNVLHSSALLGARQAIEIEHNGQRYRLQSTKSGKLILTK